ncbi:SemiSWEET family transporter [Leptogranulimonas caecicola]|jgi:uncharacterized protein with PQ loop repeat|nr:MULTISPECIES: SemiSWEET family transporter [Atopobiaceae]BCV19105.1 hypothetical protein ATOBIA_N13950 [Atopobiaceae bacterium P1]BDC91497.1 hypothetical protein ATTO_13690 [Leptogranulimonas caecicola]
MAQDTQKKKMQDVALQGVASRQDEASQSRAAATGPAEANGLATEPEICAQLPEKPWIRVLAAIATVLAVMMYVSYIPQITNNLAGDYGSPVQPFVAFVACTIWAVYGYCKRDRDWALVAANSPGIFFGLVTFLTALH